MEGVPIIDPTIFQYEGRWWLFGTRADAGDNFKLFGWHADELTGPWRPHSANPLKTDIRSSRPAGPPFVHDGALYRPAQDCSTGYGAAVVVNRVLTLTPDAFEEEIVSRIAPDTGGRYPTGLHTLCGVARPNSHRREPVGISSARRLSERSGGSLAGCSRPAARRPRRRLRKISRIGMQPLPNCTARGPIARPQRRTWAREGQSRSPRPALP